MDRETLITTIINLRAEDCNARPGKALELAVAERRRVDKIIKEWKRGQIRADGKTTEDGNGTD